MFIVFEGIDGCGKSTQAKLLAEWLEKEGHKVLLTAEPTETRLGRFIREILSGREKVDPKTLALLFTADRSEHLEKEVLPALSKGVIVVCERYYHSTIAYQSAQGVDGKWLAEINSFARKPDLTIYLDVKPKKAMERKEGREIFEDTAFLEKVAVEYKKFADVKRIDGEESLETVSAKIRDSVSGMF